MDATKAIEAVREAGGRITPERKLLLRIISDNAHLDASEIFLLAKEENPKISLSTVYRAVGLLKELEIVAADDLGEDHHHYEVQLEKHHHCVCLSCGEVVEIPAADVIEALRQKAGFKVVGAKVELTGYCKACRNKRGSNKSTDDKSSVRKGG